eukprot:gene10021-10176_t
MIKNDPAAEEYEAPPRPTALIRRRNRDSRQFMDRARIIHLRLDQQSALIQLMDPEDKLKVKQDPVAAMRNSPFMQLIARKTNTAVDTVGDLLEQIKGKRDPKNCKLLAWAKVVGSSTQCRRTGVPYSLCCGALSAKQRSNALAAVHKQQLQVAA